MTIIFVLQYEKIIERVNTFFLENHCKIKIIPGF